MLYLALYTAARLHLFKAVGCERASRPEFPCFECSFVDKAMIDHLVLGLGWGVRGVRTGVGGGKFSNANQNVNLVVGDHGRVRSQIISVACQVYVQRFDFDCNLVVKRKPTASPPALYSFLKTKL
jgi:hypothetical protein